MEGKLVKEYGDFYLISDKEIESGDKYVKLDNRPRTLLLGTTVASAKVPKLSLENCISIEKGYDIEKLAKKSSHTQALFNDIACYETGFIRGFLASVEILGDKMFSEEDMLKAYNQGGNDGASHESACGDYDSYEEIEEARQESEQNEKEFIQSLQQTEWDCIIEMECVMGCKNLILNGENSVCCGDKKPKLDAENCLILKRL